LKHVLTGRSEIKSDLLRTYPHIKLFNKEMAPKLERVLNTFAV